MDGTDEMYGISIARLVLWTQTARSLGAELTLVISENDKKLRYVELWRVEDNRWASHRITLEALEQRAADISIDFIIARTVKRINDYLGVAR